MTNFDYLKNQDAETIATEITYMFHKKCKFPWFVMGGNRNPTLMNGLDFCETILNFLEAEKDD